MQSQLVTVLFSLIFLVLLGWAFFRAAQAGASRLGPRAKWYILRLGVTGGAAFLIAILMANDYSGAAWIILWAAFYWAWKLWDRRHGTEPPQPTETQVPAPTSTHREIFLTHNQRRSPLWRRALRRTIILTGQGLGLIALLMVIMTSALHYYESRAKREREKIHTGMTVDEVLPLVRGSCGIRTHAVLPDNVPDEQLVHYVALMHRPNGTFGCDCGPNSEFREMTEPEAAELMKQKMSDGYDWRWRYTFVNDTPMHFSFTVTFGSDGRVKNVTDVWGWD